MKECNDRLTLDDGYRFWRLRETPEVYRRGPDGDLLTFIHAVPNQCQVALQQKMQQHSGTLFSVERIDLLVSHRHRQILAPGMLLDLAVVIDSPLRDEAGLALPQLHRTPRSASGVPRGRLSDSCFPCSRCSLHPSGRPPVRLDSENNQLNLANTKALWAPFAPEQPDTCNDKDDCSCPAQWRARLALRCTWTRPLCQAVDRPAPGDLSPTRWRPKVLLRPGNRHSTCVPSPANTNSLACPSGAGCYRSLA